MKTIKTILAPLLIWLALWSTAPEIELHEPEPREGE